MATWTSYTVTSRRRVWEVPAPRDLTGGVLPLWDALQPTPVTNPGQTGWGARNEQQGAVR